jgi:hypothetical protein
MLRLPVTLGVVAMVGWAAPRAEPPVRAAGRRVVIRLYDSRRDVAALGFRATDSVPELRAQTTLPTAVASAIQQEVDQGRWNNRCTRRFGGPTVYALIFYRACDASLGRKPSRWSSSVSDLTAEWWGACRGRAEHGDAVGSGAAVLVFFPARGGRGELLLTRGNAESAENCWLTPRTRRTRRTARTVVGVPSPQARTNSLGTTSGCFR